MTDKLNDQIASLKLELRAYEEDIFQHVTAIYSNVSKSNVNLKADPRNAVALLQKEVEDLLHQSREEREHVVDFHEDELEECVQLMESLSIVRKVSEGIVSAENASFGSDLEAASRALQEMKALVSTLPKGNMKVCMVLRREFGLILCQYKSRLRRLMAGCLQVDLGQISVQKLVKGTPQGEDNVLESPIALKSIWLAMIESEMFQEVVDNFLAKVWKLVMRPLWRERKLFMPHVRRGEESSELSFDAIIRDHNNGGNSEISSSHLGAKEAALLGACKMPFAQLLELLSQILSFLWTEAFCSQEELAEAVANSLQAPSITLMRQLEGTLTALIPKTEGELHSLHRAVEKPCSEFEHRLVVFGFLPEGTIGLSSIVSNINLRYAQSRRKDILGKARALVLADYHNTMMASGDALEDDTASAGTIGDPQAMLEQSGSFVLQALRFESCQVSLASCRLLKLIHEVMKLATAAQSASMANVLYQTSRDCLELFMSIVPVRFAEVIESVPRMGAVFFNDCMYIAHNTTLIAHMYRQDLGKVDERLLQAMGFIDFIPRLRNLGEKVLADHVNKQQEHLTVLVAKMKLSTEGSEYATEGMTSIGGGSIGEAVVRRGVSRASNLLATGFKLAGQFQFAKGANSTSSASSPGNSTDATSPRGSFIANNEEAAMGVVRYVDNIRSQWQGVLQESVHQRVMGYLVERILQQAMAPVLESDCIAESACGEISRVFRILLSMRAIFSQEESEDKAGHSDSWRKFEALLDLMGYSLSEVAEWLPRRKFSSFTGQEMTKLIKALFEDTPKRQVVLSTVLEMTS